VTGECLKLGKAEQGGSGSGGGMWEVVRSIRPAIVLLRGQAVAATPVAQEISPTLFPSVTEYCGRGSLTEVLAEGRRDPVAAARLTWALRLRLALDAAKGMLALHAHQPVILHRDLKGPNLLVDDSWRVKVRCCAVACCVLRCCVLRCCML